MESIYISESNVVYFETFFTPEDPESETYMTFNIFKVANRNLGLFNI